MSRVQGLYPVTVSDTEEPYTERDLTVEVEGAGVAISIPGFSDIYTTPGYNGPVVLVEFRGGVPHVVVWADINQEDPTHIISLAGASEKLRQD